MNVHRNLKVINIAHRPLKCLNLVAYSGNIENLEMLLKYSYLSKMYNESRIFYC